MLCANATAFWATCKRLLHILYCMSNSTSVHSDLLCSSRDTIVLLNKKVHCAVWFRASFVSVSIIVFIKFYFAEGASILVWQTKIISIILFCQSAWSILLNLIISWFTKDWLVCNRLLQLLCGFYLKLKIHSLFWSYSKIIVVCITDI